MHFIIDKDKDSILTMAELTHELGHKMTEEESKELKAIDANGDGAVSKEELSTYISKESAKGQQQDNEDGTIHAGDAKQLPQYTEDDVDAFFEIQDADKDGFISYEEFKAEHSEL